MKTIPRIKLTNASKDDAASTRSAAEKRPRIAVDWSAGGRSSIAGVLFFGLLITFVLNTTPARAVFDEEVPVPVSAVTIEGPTSGEVRQYYEFAADISPKDATEPIRYTWTPTPESGQGSSVVTYIWRTVGHHSIKVSATGALDKTATDTQTVEISASLPITVESVDIALSAVKPLVVGETVTATVQLQPIDAGGYSIDWTPEPERGQGKRQATFAWSAPGLHVVNVRLTNADESTVSALAVVAVEDQDGTLGPTIFMPFVAGETTQVRATVD